MTLCKLGFMVGGGCLVSQAYQDEWMTLGESSLILG